MTAIPERRTEHRTQITSKDEILWLAHSCKKHEILKPSMGPTSRRRSALLRHLDLPEHMSTNALLPVLNALYDREAFLEEAESWM